MRYLSFILLYSLLLSGITKAQTVTVDKLNYILSRTTNEAMLDNGNTWEGELTIPSDISYDNIMYDVTRIKWLAFYQCKTITGVYIPRTVCEIYHDNDYDACKNPFIGCTALQSIDVDEENGWMCDVDGVLFDKNKTALYAYPAGKTDMTYTIADGVTWIGGNAFAHNTYLRAVEIPNSVTTLNFGVFEGCRSLETIKIPDNLRYIEAGMFKDCVSMESIDIPEGVENIAEQTFMGCSKLKKIVLPESVSFVGSLVFQGCTALEKAILPSSLKDVSSGMFSDCVSLTDVTIPSGVQRISSSAFNKCSSLRILDLPETVKYIAPSSFTGCKFDALVIRSTFKESLNENVFNQLDTSSIIYAQESEIDKIKKIFKGTVLPLSRYDSFIDNNEFVAKSEEGISLKFRVISETDKTAELTGMAEDNPISDYGQLTVPAEADGYAVISIGERAFKNNNYINKVIISEGVQFIRAGAFLFCSRLNTMILPSTIRELQDYSLQSLIKNVVMLSQEPVVCGYHVFDNSIEELFESNTGEIIIDKNTTWEIGTYNHSVLFVPKGLKDKYAESSPWNLFREIVEIDGLSQDFIVPPSYEYQQNAFNLFDRLRATKKKTDNICFSPLSAQLALSMLQNGADGNTLKEMKWAMGLSEYSDGEINLFNQSLTQSLTSRPEFLPEQWQWYGDTEEEARKYYDAEYPVCEIANSIWHRPDITLLDSFTDTARSYYDAGIGSVRFDTQEGIDQINQWVSDKTHTLIPKIYNEPQSAELAVVLANALYFKGAWHTPFDKANTRPGVFHNANGSNVMTDMMTQNEYYQSTTTGKFQSLTLPYGNGDFSMTIFLPVEGTKLPDLTRADWIQTVSQPQQFRPYALTFPRFDFGDSHELNDILKKMGMSEAFDKNKAEFTRMTDCQTFISKVLQLSKISVDEAGTEAAAVTIIGMDTEGMEDPDPINYEPFRIDQPFYFTIENRKEKAVLFVGRVATLEGEPFTAQPADVNSDNTIDISDIVAVINVIAGTETTPAADVNADGKTDISDIVAIINSIAR